ALSCRACREPCLAFFFFQAEDGIRDFHVTGVQTCALPILSPASPMPLSRTLTTTSPHASSSAASSSMRLPGSEYLAALLSRLERSEERRVGKECRSRWSPYQ